MKYIYQHRNWPDFKWNEEKISPLLADVRHLQGKLLGRMESLGFNLQSAATLKNLTLDVIKSSEIEGELLDAEQVRSSIARRLGMDIAALIPSDRNVDGVVEMMLDATQNYSGLLTKKRLLGWQASLFSSGYSGRYKIAVGKWRHNSADKPMQVVSGAIGKEKVHYQAPDADAIDIEMKIFLSWFNQNSGIDPVLKAAIAHLWFVTIHPFEDGSGRIARALTDLQLARSEKSMQRFYSMSAQIRTERKGYYDVLEQTQKSTLDITAWLEWFLNCLKNAFFATNETLAGILVKARFWELHKTTQLNKRQHLMLNKLLNDFAGKLTSSKWAKIAKCSQDTAIRDIQDLMEKDILTREQSGGRSTSYQLKELPGN